MDEPADTHALLAAYAVNAVDAAERAAVERHLDGCPDCRDDLEEYRETLSRLAHGISAPPPAGLKDQLMARVHATPQERREHTPGETPPEEAADTPPRPEEPTPDGPTETPPASPPARRPGPRGVPSPRRPWETRLPWTVAAISVVLAAGLGALASAEHRSALDASRRAATASGESATLRALQDVLANPAAARVSGRAGGGGTVTAFVTTGGSAVLTSGLPGLPTGRTYQLWSVRGVQISSLGLGPSGPAAADSWNRLVGGVRPGDVLAISVEPAAGSRQPTTTPIVTLRTPAL